jgi:uncharacterized protein YbjT (DUF2867 family)
MVRDPTSPGALRLAQVGAELAVGDMDDPRSPDAAMRGAYGAGAGVAVTAGRQHLHGGVTRSIDSFAVTSLHLTKYIMRRFWSRPPGSGGPGDRAKLP